MNSSVHRKYAVLAAAGVAVFLRMTPAMGQESDAHALFDQGMRALSADRLAEACAKFEESSRLDSTALGTQFQLANCHEKAGRIASAWSLFRDVEEKARLKGQQERVEIAKNRAKALEARLPRLRIDVPVDARAGGLEIKRDGVAVAPEQWGIGVPVDPGEHVVAISAPGRQSASRRASASERHLEVVTVPPLEPAPEASAGAVTVPEPAEAPLPVEREARPEGLSVSSSRGSTQRIIGLVTAGVGVVGLGLGTGLGFAAKSKWDGPSQNGDCDASGCNDAGVAARDDARRSAVVATVVFGAGAAALVTGAVLYFTAPRDKAGALAVVPMLGVDGRAGVGVRGAF